MEQNISNKVSKCGSNLVNIQYCSRFYVNILNVVDDTGTLEGCKDLHLTLEGDLDGTDLFEKIC